MSVLPATCWCYSKPWHCLATSSRPVATFPTLMAYFQLKPYLPWLGNRTSNAGITLITAILYQHMESMNYKIHKNCYKALYLIFLIIKCHQNNYDYAICVAPLYCYIRVNVPHIPQLMKCLTSQFIHNYHLPRVYLCSVLAPVSISIILPTLSAHPSHAHCLSSPLTFSLESSVSGSGRVSLPTRSATRSWFPPLHSQNGHASRPSEKA